MAKFSQKSKDFIKRHPENDAFINILEGSVRSGKTWTMIPKILFKLVPYEVPGDRIIFGVSKQTIYKNVLNELFNFVGTGNYSFDRQSGDLWLFGTLWSVVGAKDEGSEKYIRGRTVGLAYGDELTLMPESFFKMMLTRMSPEGARLYGTTNPDSPYHWLKTDYLDNKKMRDKGQLWSEKFILPDNLSLSQEKIEQYHEMYKGVFKKRYIDGLWVVAEGSIYKDSYHESLEYTDEERPAGLLIRGGYVEQCVPIDYGTGNPTVFLHIIDDGDTFWIDNEYYYDSRNTDESGTVLQTDKFQKTDGQYVDDLQAFLTEFCPDAQCIVDPSAASFKAEMTQKGIWHIDAENEVLDGIRTVSTLLARKKIRINKRCVKLIAELQTYAWDPRAAKLGEDKPLKKHDHAPDALRYFCHTKVPAWRIAA
jgi:PBSX family phage terminase large subunit